MHAGTKKALVQSFFEYFSAGNAIQALELLDDTAVWQAMGQEGGLPMSGKMDKEAIGKTILWVRETLPQGLKFTYLAWTVEGERVAVEMEAHGVKANGIEYKNCYHFLILIPNHKITVLREYMDTLQVKRVFIDDKALAK